MTLQINIDDLRKLIAGYTYLKDGDIHERTHGDLIINDFPNSELFWKYFVTPITNRVVLNSKQDVKIRARDSISTDIFDLSINHYSVFLNLVYATNCLNNKHLSFFENFYAHLGSVCDLAEEFITQLYLITLECEDKKTEILQTLSKTKYLKLAGEWYDMFYPNTHKYYLSKGKTPPLVILGRSNILDEYYGADANWKAYKKCAQEIRTYRNAIVHNSQIGSHMINDDVYVPKRNKISGYKKVHQVFSVTPDTPKFKNDFTERESQMKKDILELKYTLNNIWNQPIRHFEELLFNKKNSHLLEKYDIKI